MSHRLIFSSSGSFALVIIITVVPHLAKCLNVFAVENLFILSINYTNYNVTEKLIDLSFHHTQNDLFQVSIKVNFGYL